jgi:nucleotide-binding universal stress UspA family protein
MMPEDKSVIEYSQALEDFRNARAKARMRHLWSSITGRSRELYPYDEISQKMHMSGLSSKGVHDIPVEAIVGSVNRYKDFDRNFLPLRDSDMQRWASVKATMTSPGSMGLPPIRVYKIGDAYFVLDGNHRVSIAKQMEMETIEAYVTEIKTKVSFSAEDSPEDIILKEEYADFLEETNFDRIVPDVDLQLTFPGQYETLREHIRVHRHYMGIEQSREIPEEEAVLHWYESVYKPIVEIIREQNILREFPQRTETDLYIWVLDHQTYMQEELGWYIRPEKAAFDLVNRRGKRFLRVLRRYWEKFLRFLLPNKLEDFSSPGEWHEQKEISKESLFTEILVAINGSSESWIAVEQGVIIAEMERADLRGLVVRSYLHEKFFDENDLSKAFSERLKHSGLYGNMAFAEGPIAETISDRARFNDLVVLKLLYPPSPKIFRRLSSGFRTILRKSTRPILVIRDQVSVMNHILLAYDGSPKSKEALFISAYFALKYQKRITVVVVEKDNEKGNQLLQEAKKYLGNVCVSMILVSKSRRIGKEILRVADDQKTDLIVMGGYGLSPFFEVIFGSTVDSILRGTNIPVLISQ